MLDCHEINSLHGTPCFLINQLICKRRGAGMFAEEQEFINVQKSMTHFYYNSDISIEDGGDTFRKGITSNQDSAGWFNKILK